MSPQSKSRAKRVSLRKALEDLLDLYVSLVNSGDAGFWDPEEVSEVIQARAALSGKAL